MFNQIRRLFKGSSPSPDPYALDRVLLDLSPVDVWTGRDAVSGCLILGETGSGKSSASGRAISLAALDAGFGALVIAAKGDDVHTFREYCRQTNRLSDLEVVGPNAAHRMNFLDEELKGSSHMPGGATLNIVAMLMSVLDVANRSPGSGDGKQDSDPFWRNSTKCLLSHAVEILLLARGTLSVADIHRLILSAPQSPAQVHDQAWQKTSLCFRCLVEADRSELSEEQRLDLAVATTYLLEEFPSISPRTRSIIVSSVTAMTDPLLRGTLRTLFSTDTTLSPSATALGKVIVVNLPPTSLRDAGRLGSCLWKISFQRFSERRDVRTSPRPLLLFLDEAHLTLMDTDPIFLSTARSSRVATVMVGQNIPTFYAALGAGEQGRSASDALLGNLATKILHANADPETCRWASQLGGQRLRFLMNSNSNRPEPGWHAGNRSEGSTSAGFSESMLPDLDGSELLKLRSGGPLNKWLSDAIVIRSGGGFRASGRNWMRCTFSQAPADPR